MEDSIVKENGEIEGMLTKYFQKKYNLNSTFMFSHIEYKYKYFGMKRILDLNNGGQIKEVQEEILERNIASIPILVPDIEDWDYEQFMLLNSGMKIDEVIDLESGTEEDIRKDLLDKIKQIMPEGIGIIEEKDLHSALEDLGYTAYKFNFTNLGSLGDGRIATQFCGTVGCDYNSFPRNSVTKEVANSLEELYSNNKLDMKLKRYGIGTKDKPINITDCFEEYTYEGEKYIRVSSKSSSDIELSNGEKIEDGKPYWIKVEESKTNDKLSSIHDIHELQEIIPSRRQGKIVEVMSEFITEHKRDNEDKDKEREEEL